MKKTKPPKGIRQKGNRWEVYVTVNGERVWTTFPLATPLQTMEVWRRDQRHVPPPSDSFAADIASYLLTVQHMPTFHERSFHLQFWQRALGPERARATITTTEINQCLSKLKASGKSNTTVRHYRTALLHLFNRLDPDGLNPVKRTWKPADPPLEARALEPAVVWQILKAIKGPKTKARLWVMATTGLPHKQLMQLTPASVDWPASRVLVLARRKGAGAAGRWLPLSKSARYAFRSLDKAEGWGAFSVGGMRQTFQRALKALGLPSTIRPYDIRHMVGTELYRATGDLATVARLLGHADIKTASRYSLAAHELNDRLAMDKVRIGG
jgi:integrase